jgi:hypothetical protein
VVVTFVRSCAPKVQAVPPAPWVRMARVQGRGSGASMVAHLSKLHANAPNFWQNFRAQLLTCASKYARQCRDSGWNWHRFKC